MTSYCKITANTAELDSVLRELNSLADSAELPPQVVNRMRTLSSRFPGMAGFYHALCVK